MYFLLIDNYIYIQLYIICQIFNIRSANSAITQAVKMFIFFRNYLKFIFPRNAKCSFGIYSIKSSGMCTKDRNRMYVHFAYSFIKSGKIRHLGSGSLRTVASPMTTNPEGMNLSRLM